MAKKSMILKQQAPAKFSTRKYNRCKICGRPHAYLRNYGICRICFRELAYKGQIPELLISREHVLRSARTKPPRSDGRQKIAVEKSAHSTRFIRREPITPAIWIKRPAQAN